MSFTIQGWAIPFNEPAYIHGEWLVVDSIAFDRALARGHDAYLCVGHRGERIDCVLTLFKTPDAIAFEAVGISIANWQGLRHGLVSDLQYCSAAFTTRVAGPDRLPDGTRCQRIMRATIEHVALVANPAFPQTSVWARDCGGEWPNHLIEAAARFEIARAQWRKAAFAPSGLMTAASIRALIQQRSARKRGSNAKARAYAAWRMAGGLRDYNF